MLETCLLYTSEDALRIMRGFRFAASLDFDIEPDTFTAMAAHAPLLEKISVERSFIEFDKLLMAPFWRKGIKAMITSQAQKYLPYLETVSYTHLDVYKRQICDCVFQY